MAYLPSAEFYFEIARGNVPGMSVVHKFGRNSAVGTTYGTIAIGGYYRTPQVAGATTLRVKAGGDANDTAAGTGAQEITLQGLDQTGALAQETVATAGASASSATTTTFIRLFRAWVSKSGSYATTSVESHAASIVIEDGAGTQDWATIDYTNFARSQSEIGAYTIPLGKTGYLTSFHANIESNKSVSLLMFKREGILDTAAPYDAMRLQMQLGLTSGNVDLHPACAYGPYPELTDIGFMAAASASAECDVDFEIVLVDN